MKGILHLVCPFYPAAHFGILIFLGKLVLTSRGGERTKRERKRKNLAARRNQSDECI